MECSKNNERIALEGLNHESSILSPDDSSVLKINWEPKSKNIVEISKYVVSKLVNTKGK